jgi:hypothetical protein
VAFARPYFAESGDGTGLHIVAVDRSFSMGAPEAFARALDLARSAIASRGAGRVAVVAFDDRADVVAPPGPPGEARAALGDLRAGYGGTRYDPLIARAIELTGHGRSRLTIVSDLQRAGWEDEDPARIPEGIEVELIDAGAPRANAAVVDLRREADAVVASIRHDGASDRTATARLVSSEGRTLASAPFTAPAQGTVDVSLPYRAPEQGSVAVEVDDPGGYPADDRRFLVLDPPARARVLLVVSDPADEGFYVSRALQAADDGALEVKAARAATLGRASGDELAGAAAVLLLSTRRLDRRGRDLLTAFVQQGGGLFVAASPDLEAATLAAIAGSGKVSAVEQEADLLTLAATDLRHPIFRPLGALAANLGQVRFSRTWRVDPAGWEVAARFTDGSAALLERRHRDGRVVLFASDVDRRWNDFPLHPAFVPFVLEAIRHLVPAVDSRRDFSVANAPDGARNEPGVYMAGGRRVAVNVDVRESGAARLTPEEFTAMLQPEPQQPGGTAARQARQVEAEQSLWRYGLMLMLAALVVESVTGRSR